MPVGKPKGKRKTKSVPMSGPGSFGKPKGPGFSVAECLSRVPPAWNLDFIDPRLDLSAEMRVMQRAWPAGAVRSMHEGATTQY